MRLKLQNKKLNDLVMRENLSIVFIRRNKNKQLCSVKFCVSHHCTCMSHFFKNLIESMFNSGERCSTHDGKKCKVVNDMKLHSRVTLLDNLHVS